MDLASSTSYFTSFITANAPESLGFLAALLAIMVLPVLAGVGLKKVYGAVIGIVTRRK